MAETTKLGGSDRPPREEQSPRASRTRNARPGARGTGSGGTTPPGAVAPSPLRGDEKKLRDSLVQMYSTIGVTVTSIALMRDDIALSAAGVNIVTQGEAAADAWLDLARQNPRVKSALQGFVQGSAVATLGACHVAMVAPVLSARGVIAPQVGAMFLSPEARQHVQEAAEAQRRAAAQAQSNGQ